MGVSRPPFFNVLRPIVTRFAEKRSVTFPLRMGLNLKLAVIAVVILLVSVVPSSLLVRDFQRQQLIASSETTVTRLSSTIIAGLEHAMMSNDRTTAGEIVQRMASEAGIGTIHVLDAQGIVQISSQPGALGARFDYSQSTCQFCHIGGVKPTSRTSIIAMADGRQALLNVSLIRNSQQCTPCHSPQRDLLGLLMVEMPLTDLSRQLAAISQRILLSSLGTVVVLTALMALAFRRLATQPLSDLVKGVAHISAGDMDYQVRVSSRDELGDLAEAFDAMRRKLRASQAEMQRRNQELLMLNEIALAAGQSRDLQQMLDLALQMVMNRLGIQAGHISLFDEETGSVTERACREMSEAQCQELERMRQQISGDHDEHAPPSSDDIQVIAMASDSCFRTLWDDPQGRLYVVVPLKAMGHAAGAMGLITGTGQSLTEHDIDVLRAVGYEISIFVDNALLVAQTRRNEQEATALYEIGTRIAASLELNQVVDAVAEGVRQLLGSDIGVVGLLDQEREEISVKAAAGTRTEALRGLRISVAKHAPGSVLGSGQPIVIHDLLACLPIPHDAGHIAAEGIVSSLVVPLWRGGHLLGLAGAMMRHHRRFTQGDIRLLTRLALIAGVAIENAQLYEQVRHLVVLEERERLARELHDELAQALAYLNIKATLIGELLRRDQRAEAQAGLIELKGVAQEAYTDVREAIFGLRTTASLGLGLLPALREYISEYQSQYGLDTRLDVDISEENLPRFSPDVDVQLLRIIQEALSNVRKHAQTNRAWIRFQQEQDRVCISVEDAGRGFDPSQITGEGRRYFGLQIMRERAESVGASLDLDSRPGQGTRIVIRVPRSLGGQNI